MLGRNRKKQRQRRAGRRCYIQDSLPEGAGVSFRCEKRDKGKALALEVEKAEGKNPGRSIGYILKGETGQKMKSPDGLPGKQNKHCAHVFRGPVNVENYVVEVCGAKEFEERYLTGVLDAVLKLYDKKSEGIVFRVRVTDLECLEKDLGKCFDKKPVTLQPLSQPKFNPEFYMKKPHKDAVFWTYGYYVDSKGHVHKNMAGVNGRKFYWRHADFKMESCMAEPSTKSSGR